MPPRSCAATGAEAGIRAARAAFNPQLSVGVGGSWQPYYPNRTGATTVDGSAFVKLSLPIFHWGERRRATASPVPYSGRANGTPRNSTTISYATR